IGIMRSAVALYIGRVEALLGYAVAIEDDAIAVFKHKLGLRVVLSGQRQLRLVSDNTREGCRWHPEAGETNAKATDCHHVRSPRPEAQSQWHTLLHKESPRKTILEACGSKPLNRTYDVRGQIIEQRDCLASSPGNLRLELQIPQDIATPEYSKQMAILNDGHLADVLRGE